MHKKILTIVLLSLTSLQTITAKTPILSLDSCRTLAVDNNKELKIADTDREKAHYNRKSAFTNYLPKVNLTGVYMHTGRELSLLSDEQKTTLSHIGDAMSMPALNAAGQGIVDALHTDTRNAGAAAVMLTQPVYMGGKIRAYNKIAGYAEEISTDKYNLKYQELVTAVDETYWTIVALASRKRLAKQYLTLVKTLDSDVGKMKDEGFATTADGLSVKVKVNEANVALIQVDNGLELLKMRLCQLCGLPPESEITLLDEEEYTPGYEECELPTDTGNWEKRPELSATSTAVRVLEEKVKIARAEFLPTIALTGGYAASNPSVFNSFERKFKGTWSIGVAVNVPLVTWGDHRYKVNAAKAEMTSAKLEYEELREKIELQVSQRRLRVREAMEKRSASLSSQREADENLRYATVGMKEGVIPVSNVIEAQTAWLAAKTNLIDSDIELRLAHVYLKKALGTIK